MRTLKLTVLAAFVSMFVSVAETPAQQQVPGSIQPGGSFDCTRNSAGQSIPTLVCQTSELRNADLRQIQVYYTLRHAQPERREELRVQFTTRIQALARECSTEPVLASASQPACVARALNDLRSFWLQQLQQTRNVAALEESQRSTEDLLRAQQALKSAGFLPAHSVVDGVYGTGTREALARFQTERGIAGGGFLTGATLSAGLLANAASPSMVQSRLPPCPSDLSLPRHMCYGAEAFPNGDRFVGEYRDNQRHGHGAYTHANGERYVGEYRNNQRTGQGTLIFAHGDRYVGEFREGNFHGQGTYTHANGDLYRGEYRNNKRTGHGTYIHIDGSRYVGEFKDSQPDGLGTETLPNGQSYIGEFRNGKRHGWGTYTFAGGERYVGEYRENQRSGQGSLFSSDHRLLQNGIWRNGEFILANNIPNPVIAAQTAPTRPSTQANSGTSVRLIREAGTFKVPVRINGVLDLHFTVDSGAADVTIPADVVLTLFRTGTIRDSDFVGEQTYRLADGSTVKSRTFRIRQLQVGSRTVENVLGSVAGVEGSLLLGQSFLSRFQRVSFDYAQGLLVLE